MGSSLNLSATVEALMLGIVMGRAPRLPTANSDKLGQLCYLTSRHRPHHGFRPFRLRTLARALKSVGRFLGRAWVAEAWLQFKKGPTLGI